MSELLLGLTFMSFLMGVSINRLTPTIPGDIDSEKEIRYKCFVWYFSALFFLMIFLLYKVSDLNSDVHKWFWWRAVDIFFVTMGAYVAIYAYGTCRTLKLDVHK